MTSYWQTTWNSKLYDYQKLIADFKANRTLEVNNSKGLAKMKIVPHIGDVVFVSCDKKKIMTCSVISNFEEDNDGSYDEYCIGPRDTHKYSQNNIVLRLKILEVYDNPDVMLGFQRTWVKLKTEMMN
jgi:hypothetical protein